MMFDPFAVTMVLLGGAVIIQDLELLVLRKNFATPGIWSWETLKRDNTRWGIRGILNLLCRDQVFPKVIALRLFAALLLIISKSILPVIVLWFCSLLIAIRFRGIFNGGSDYMTLVVLNGLLAHLLFPESAIVALGALYYIAIQSAASYLISGVVKLRSKNWREGMALPAFIQCGAFPAPLWMNSFTKSKPWMIGLSWGLIAFECLFPLAFLSPELALIFLVSGTAFHLLNAYLLGLNRFLHIWVTTYPAILWCVV